MPRHLRLILFLLLALRLAGQNCDDPGVRVTAERSGDTVRIFVETANCLDITLTVTPEVQNMRSSVPLPVTIDTRGRNRVDVVTLRRDDRSQPWSYRYRYSWRYGGRGGRPDRTVYALPFAGGTGRRLLQGYGGSYSHQAGSPNEHAHDWDMPEGTTVLAARAGLVVGVRQDSRAGGPSDQFKNCANYVIIRHDDDTYGEYLHLQPGGAIVRLGDRVEAGDAIARSGNTGFSSRPHLHFAVFRALDGARRETLPVQFRTRDGAVVSLQSGKTY